MTFLRWTRGPALPSHSTVGFLRPAVTPPAHLTPTSSSGGGSPADSVTSSPPLIRDFRELLGTISIRSGKTFVLHYFTNKSLA